MSSNAHFLRMIWIRDSGSSPISKPKQQISVCMNVCMQQISVCMYMHVCRLCIHVCASMNREHHNENIAHEGFIGKYPSTESNQHQGFKKEKQRIL